MLDQQHDRERAAFELAYRAGVPHMPMPRKGEGYAHEAQNDSWRMWQVRGAMTDEDGLHNLIDRLSTILTGVANALKGRPEPGSAHSWHDLVQIAELLTAELEVLREEV